MAQTKESDLIYHRLKIGIGRKIRWLGFAEDQSIIYGYSTVNLSTHSARSEEESQRIDIVKFNVFARTTEIVCSMRFANACWPTIGFDRNHRRIGVIGATGVETSFVNFHIYDVVTKYYNTFFVKCGDLRPNFTAVVGGSSENEWYFSASAWQPTIYKLTLDGNQWHEGSLKLIARMTHAEDRWQFVAGFGGKLFFKDGIRTISCYDDSADDGGRWSNNGVTPRGFGVAVGREEILTYSYKSYPNEVEMKQYWKKDSVGDDNVICSKFVMLALRGSTYSGMFVCYDLLIFIVEIGNEQLIQICHRNVSPLIDICFVKVINHYRQKWLLTNDDISRVLNLPKDLQKRYLQ